MMKKFSLFPLGAALLLAVSCEKPLTEAEKNAQIEREVQQRLAAERQANDQAQLAQQQADLAAREQALADKEAAASESAVAVATPRATARPVVEERSVSSSDSRSPRSYDTFYRKLEPYGAWRETNDYGYVWQPREAQSRNWRPYTNGRWAYTDAGWTWVSSEPHGWATCHYGRWTRLRGVGWVWVPGEEWAPAWVSWRSSDQHVGWAPLPPEARFERKTGIKKWADSYYDIDVDEYVFIPNEDIGSENIERSVIPVERNVTIVNETTNVTNITYSNTTIVNEGPNYEMLRGRSRRPLERMRLERRYNVEEDQAPQPSARGDVLAIMTPLFTARAVERPRNVGAPIAQVTVERGSATNADQPEAQRAREKMKSEATAPSDAPAKKFEKPMVAAGTPAPQTAATASPTVAATAAPTATPTPAISATPVPTAATTPAPSTPAATATPRVLPTATPTPVAQPSTPAATATPRVLPTATPTPVAKPSTPLATATPRVLPTATPTPVATPSAPPTPKPVTPPTPSAAPSARPITPPTTVVTTPTPPALVPRSTVAATPVTATPGSVRPPAPAATTRPLGTARPGTDPPETFPADTPSGAASEERKGRDGANAKIRDTTSGRVPAPTIAPPATVAPAAVRAVTPPAAVPVATPTPIVPAAVTTPPTAPPTRSREALPPVTAPPALAPPPVAPAKPPTIATPTPTPTPTPGAKDVSRPDRPVDVPGSPNAKTPGTDEP